MKKLLLILLVLVLALSVVSCEKLENNSENPNDVANEDDFDRSKITFLSAYNKATSLGFEGTLEEFIELLSGKNGIDGEDGVSIESVEINEEGELLVTLSSGEVINCGNVKGKDGEDGKEGATPTIEISEDGYWVINGVKTEYKAVGKEGATGQDGKPGSEGKPGNDGVGIDKVEFDDNGDLLITFTDGRTQKVEMPEKQQCAHKYDSWKPYGEYANIHCNNRLYYHVCSECNIVELKHGSDSDHRYVLVTTPPTCVDKGFDTKTCSECGISITENETPTVDHIWQEKYSYNGLFHWIECKNCDSIKEKKEHSIDDSGYCTECMEYLISSEGIVYEISEDGTYAIVVGYNGESERIAIEEEYEGLPVREVGNSAFYNCDVIKSINIPNSVKTIGRSAFSQCEGLETVIFEENSQLEIIDDSAFAYADYLSEIELPESLTSIGNNAFDKTSIREIVIPKNVVSIGIRAFSDCQFLEYINVADENTVYESQYGVLFTKGKTSLLQDPAGNDDVSYYNVPYGTTSIDVSAFYSCYKLVRVYLPQTVKTIESNAFAYCENMEYISLSEGLLEIRSDAFFNCLHLNQISIPSSVCTIEEGAFSSCLALKEIYVPYSNEHYVSNNGVLYTKDEKMLLQYPVAKTGEDFYIPDGVSTICASAFADNMYLCRVIVPTSVISINYNAFAYCNNLYSVMFEEGSKLETLERYAFSNCNKLSTFVIPDGVTNIEDAFYSCGGLVSITIPSSVEFGFETFYSCNKLVEVINHTDYDITPGSDEYGGIARNALIVHSGESKIVEDDGFLFLEDNGVNYLLGYNGSEKILALPESYNNEAYEIYKHAFENRLDILYLLLSDGVLAIGENAFYGCREIISVTLGQNLVSIDEYAFSGCYRIFEIINHSSLDILPGDEDNGQIASSASIVHSGDSVIQHVNDYIFATCNGENYLLNYIGSDTKLVLPDLYNGETYVIADYAFYWKETVESITISDGVTEIGVYAFHGCYMMSSLTIGNNVTVIGDSFVGNCVRIEKIVVPASVQKIGRLFIGGFFNIKPLQIVIESPEGWYSSSSADFNDATSVDPNHLSDPFLATRYLITQYVYSYLAKQK